MFARWLQYQWFEQRRPSPALWLLLPLSGIFFLLSRLKQRLVRPLRMTVPVVVVGNITVGGAGKTPLTLWLAGQLRTQGMRPGIVSRGYGGRASSPCPVSLDADPAQVGDEPLLLARRSACPVWVGRDRAAAGQALLAANPEIDVLLCDDGLQHYRLARDVELAVFDGRGAGNGHLLPAGPLREPLGRLSTVDAIICNGLPDPRLPRHPPSFDMALQPGCFYALGDATQTCSAEELKGRKLHALAGIGDPRRFFRTLAALGLAVEEHPFPDHHAYSADDLCFAKDGVLLMTEKDAVKCAGLTTGEAWVLPVEAGLSPALTDLIVEKLRGRPIA